MVAPQFFNRRKQRKRLRQKSVCKSSLADNRNLASDRINLNHNLVLLQSIINSISRSSFLPVISTNHNICFIYHVAITNEKTVFCITVREDN